MIIYLNMVPREFNRMKSAERRSFFEKFVEASRRGNHVFITHTSLSRWVSNKEHLSVGIKNHLKYLHEINSYQSFEEIMSKYNHLEIRFGKSKPKLEKPKKWVIGHEKILSGNYLEPCCLLVENEKSDGKVYELILKFESSKFGTNSQRLNLKLSYELIGGQGGNIVNEFVRLVGEGKIVCCVCDSDKLAPNDDFGDTFKSVTKKRNTPSIQNMFVGVLTSTPCHESENFLSIDIIRELLDGELKWMEKNSIKYKERIEKFKKIINNVNVVEEWLNKQPDTSKKYQLWFFLDLKNGVNSDNEKVSLTSSDVKQWLTREYGVKTFEEISIPGIYDELMGMFIKSGKSQGLFHKHMTLGRNDWDRNVSPWIDDLIWYLYGQERNDYEEV